jgi:hypothetical protein
MSMTSIPELEEYKKSVQRAFSMADAAVYKGKITEHQRDALLRSKFGSSEEHVVLTRIDRQLTALRSRN